MANITLNDLTSSFGSQALLNENFTAIETALNTDVLYKTGTEANAMQRSLDMNSNKVINQADGTNNTDGATVSQLTAAIGAAASGLIASQVESQKGSDIVGSVTTFTEITYTQNANNLEVFLNGVRQNKTRDYAETSVSSITWVVVPSASDDLDFRSNTAITNSTTTTSAITHTDTGTDYNLANYLQDFNLLTRDHFANDAAFDTYIASVTEYSKFDILGFYSSGNAATGVSTGPRGLLVRQLADNLSGAVNVCPNGTVSATNAAKSNARVWDIDIRANPTAARRAFAIEMHQDGDNTTRGRLSTRSEGTSALKHIDVYHQFNGNNCFYSVTARAGIGASAISMGWFPQPTTVKLDFQTTQGGESSTGTTNYWIAAATVAIGDEKAVLSNDYQFLVCTTGGVTGGSEPSMSITGTTGVTDNAAVWTIKSRIQKAGNIDAIPTIWMDEDEFTGFGTMQAAFPFDFADTTNFQKINRYSSTAGVTAAGVSSLDNSTLLTTEINEVSTVATDAGVRLPTAAAGKKVSIVNNGANTLKVWPFSGDNLGAGTNTNITLAVGVGIDFHCYGSNNWYSV